MSCRPWAARHDAFAVLPSDWPETAPDRFDTLLASASLATLHVNDACGSRRSPAGALRDAVGPVRGRRVGGGNVYQDGDAASSRTHFRRGCTGSGASQTNRSQPRATQDYTRASALVERHRLCISHSAILYRLKPWAWLPAIERIRCERTIVSIAGSWRPRPPTGGAFSLLQHRASLLFKRRSMNHSPPRPAAVGPMDWPTFAIKNIPSDGSRPRAMERRAACQGLPLFTCKGGVSGNAPYYSEALR